MNSKNSFFPSKTRQKALIYGLPLLLSSALTLGLAPHSCRAAGKNDAGSLRWAGCPASNKTQSLDPKNVPDFPAYTPQANGQRIQNNSSTLRADLASTTLPLQTHLKLILETAVDARTSQPGDIFEAHVRDDLFLGNTLLLGKGSLIRGRVAEVTRPRLLSRAARIGLKLEQINTPAGEVIPLDAALEFQKGLTNQKGQFDPGTNFGSRVESNVKAVTGLSSTGNARNALIAANVVTLGAPAIATAIGGSAVAIFRSGDNVQLTPGQELEIQLTNDLGLQLN